MIPFTLAGMGQSVRYIKGELPFMPVGMGHFVRYIKGEIPFMPVGMGQSVRYKYRVAPLTLSPPHANFHLRRLPTNTMSSSKQQSAGTEEDRIHAIDNRKSTFRDAAQTATQDAYLAKFWDGSGSHRLQPFLLNQVPTDSCDDLRSWYSKGGDDPKDISVEFERVTDHEANNISPVFRASISYT
jgi:hypothetical protein